jgi:hypothetical protein
MVSILELIFAYGLILFVLSIPPPSEVPIKAQFVNSESEAVAICWMSSYTREHELISGSLKDCYEVKVNDQLNMQTYAGHRFLAFPVQRRAEAPTRYFSMEPQTTRYHISFSGMESLSLPLSSDQPNISVSYVWNTFILRYRHELMMTFALFLIAWEIFFPTRTPKDSLKTVNSSSKQLAVPRQELKAFATTTMLLNHASYIFLRASPAWLRLGCLPADLAGSMHLYCWLTGYNFTPQSRSESWMILTVYILLEHFCRLPSPFAYESLMTIVLARKLLSTSFFETFLLKWSLCFHACFIALCLQFAPIFNADGLRVLQVTGFLYAIAGRMFVLPVDASKRLIWLFAASLKIILLIWTLTIKEIDLSSVAQVVVTTLCLLWFTFHLVLLGFPLKEPLRRYTPNLVVTFLSRYSLEIYGVHLFLAYAYQLYLQR